MNRPQKLWTEFREAIYGTEPLPPEQERECTLAFYAGMICSFIEVSQISVNAKNEDVGAFELELFKREIDRASTLANLDRNTGKS